MNTTSDISMIDTPSFDTIGIIGVGKMGATLADALSLNGESVTHVAGRTSLCPKARMVARRIGAQDCTVQSVANNCCIVFIATADEAIEDVATRTAWRTGQAIIHLSGAMDISVLDNARRRGAYVGGLHPLQSISQSAGNAQSFNDTTFSIEVAHAPLKSRLCNMVEQLGGRINNLPCGCRMRYHAAANHASALLISLLTDMRQLWHSIGGSEEDMLAALLPLMKGTLQGVEKIGIDRALTGPLARGDIATLEGHLKALAQEDRELSQRYIWRHLPLLNLSPPTERAAFEALFRRYLQPS